MTDKNDTNRETDAFLDVYFEAARQRPEEVSDKLLSRVLEDGLATQSGFEHGAFRVGATAPRAWARAFDALGGWPAMAGLSCAGVAGIWIGVAPPDALMATAHSLLGTDALSALDLDAGFLSSGGSL